MTEKIKKEKKKTKYEIATPDVEQTCRRVLSVYKDEFSFIKPEEIEYVFKDSEKSSFIGQIRLLKGSLSAFLKKKICITIWKQAWDGFDNARRLLLIYHELTHLTWNEKKECYGLVKHDIQDFQQILQPYGLNWENAKEFEKEMLQKEKEIK